MRKALSSPRKPRQRERRVAGDRKGARRASGPILTEEQIRETCCDFLRLDGWTVRRMEPVSDRARGRGANELGMPDVLAMRSLYEIEKAANESLNLGYKEQLLRSYTQTVWIEFKRPGGSCTPLQRAWHATERARGALVWVMGDPGDPDANITPATIEAFRAHYMASGLARNVKA